MLWLSHVWRGSTLLISSLLAGGTLDLYRIYFLLLSLSVDPKISPSDSGLHFSFAAEFLSLLLTLQETKLSPCLNSKDPLLCFILSTLWETKAS